MTDALESDNDRREEPALGRKQVLKYAEDLARTYEELKISERRYRALWHVGKSLLQHVDMDELILNIIRQIKETMEAGDVSVILYEETSEEFIVYGTNESPESLKKERMSRLPSVHGVAEGVLKSGEPEKIAKSRKKPQPSEKLAAGSIMASPLRINERTFGVLEVSRRDNGAFEDKDLFFLTTLSPIVAMALDNARMYAALERSYKELQTSDRRKDSLIQNAQEENIRLRQAIESRYRFDQIVGYSERMLDVFRLCEKVKGSDITVLVQGETGTGKELIARCIHHNSPRKERLFITQNCAGIPDTLLASELFGHKRGAYTGAVSDKKGLFEIADGGTIFLDEVAEMSAAMQISLLRVLQEGEIKPLGADYARKVDVRVISATNRDLENDVETGKFREDLLYRLNVFTIKLPPLRERTGDISVLAKFFMEKYTKKSRKSISGITPETLCCLEAYRFPGNVRELENEMERAVAMAEAGERIDVSHLSDKIRPASSPACSDDAVQGSLMQMVEALEKTRITQALKSHGGNKTRAAGELGLSRNGLMKKMKRYGL